MIDQVKPALTLEEWRLPKVMFRPGRHDEGYGIELIATGDRKHFVNADTWAVVFDGSWAVALSNPVRHKLAALALHGQPFGFTREDVGFLRGLWRELALASDYEAVRHIATRIEALLPPENAK